MIEDNVCSLNLCKKLDELGVEQKSFFHWDKVNTPIPHVVLSTTESERSGHFRVCAFTPSELFNILPYVISTGNEDIFQHYRFNMTRSLVASENDPVSFRRNFIINYLEQSIPIIKENGEYMWPKFANQLMEHNIYHYKLSDALAMTLIYLIEKGLINGNS